jgi:hypothetical protein
MAFFYLKETNKTILARSSPCSQEEQTPLLSQEEDESATIKIQDEVDEDNKPDQDPLPSTFSRIATVSTAFAILPYISLCLIESLYDNGYSLWSITSIEYGGLAFSAADVGFSLAILGFFGLIAQCTIYTTVQKMFGVILCYRWSMVAYCASALLLPTNNIIASLVSSGVVSTMWLWASLIFALTLRVLGDTFAYTSSMIFVS